jgi:hypothetical protein
MTMALHRIDQIRDKRLKPAAWRRSPAQTRFAASEAYEIEHPGDVEGDLNARDDA